MKRDLTLELEVARDSLKDWLRRQREIIADLDHVEGQLALARQKVERLESEQ